LRCPLPVVFFSFVRPEEESWTFLRPRLQSLFFLFFRLVGTGKAATLGILLGLEAATTELSLFSFFFFFFLSSRTRNTTPLIFPPTHILPPVPSQGSPGRFASIVGPLSLAHGRVNGSYVFRPTNPTPTNPTPPWGPLGFWWVDTLVASLFSLFPSPCGLSTHHGSDYAACIVASLSPLPFHHSCRRVCGHYGQLH